METLMAVDLNRYHGKIMRYLDINNREYTGKVIHDFYIDDYGNERTRYLLEIDFRNAIEISRRETIMIRDKDGNKKNNYLKQKRSNSKSCIRKIVWE